MAVEVVIIKDDDDVEVKAALAVINTPNEEATCPICMDAIGTLMNGVSGKRRKKIEYKESDGWRMRCGHKYCVGCLSSWIESKIKAHEVPIKCAIVECQREIRPGHIQNILNIEQFEKFSQLVAIKEHESESMYCPNMECSQMFLKPIILAGYEQTICVFCKIKICVRCHVMWHDGLTCDEYQRMTAARGDAEEAQLMALKDKHKWKQCPKCKILVEKVVGCNFMKCKWYVQCMHIHLPSVIFGISGQRFCYKCGVPYPDRDPKAAPAVGQNNPHGPVVSSLL
jgi:E3 ubiquitin-protein ligase RNF144